MPEVNASTTKLKASWEAAGLNDAAWKAAEDFFRTHPDAVKFRRKRLSLPVRELGEHKASYQDVNTNTNTDTDTELDTAQAFSFIKVGEGLDNIFAIANKEVVGHFLGRGAYGKVKMAQNRKREQFAIKIENRSLRAQENAEKRVMQVLDYLVGEAARFAGFKQGASFPQKLYTLMKLVEGQALGEFLYGGISYEKALDTQTNVQIAINACLAVQFLHDKGIVHGDLHPGNFMVNVKGEQILVKTIDFGHARLIPQNKLPALKQIAYDDLFISDLAELIKVLSRLALNENEIPAIKAIKSKTDLSSVLLKNLIQELQAYALQESQLNTIIQSSILSADDTQLQKLIIDGITPEVILQKAILLNSLESVQWIISHYPELARIELYEHGTTALILAVQHNQIEIVKYLLDEGANWRQTNYEGQDILILSIEQHSVELVNYLCGHLTQDEFERAIIASAKQGHIDIVELLIGEYTSIYNNINTLKNSALMAAIKAGHIDMVQFLMIHQDKEQSDIEQRAAYRKNVYPQALHAAAKHGQFEIIQWLVEDLLGIEQNLPESDAKDTKWAEKIINDPNKNKITPLMEAAQKGDYKIVDYLKNKSKPRYLKKAFLLAAEYGHIEVIKSLLDKVDEQTKEESFHAALEKNHFAIALLLLKLKPMLNDQDKKQLLILSVAQGDMETLLSVIDENISIKREDIPPGLLCQSLLEVAVMAGHFEIIELLLNKIHRVGLNGLISSHVMDKIAQFGRVDVFKLLFEKKTLDLPQANLILDAIMVYDQFEIFKIIFNNIETDSKMDFLEEALRLAIKNDNDIIIDFLLTEAGAIINDAQLLLAVKYGSRSILYAWANQAVLAQNGIVINFGIKTQSFYTVLLEAVKQNQRDMVMFLLDNAQDITTDQYNEALRRAVRNNHLGICLILINKGAKLIDEPTLICFVNNLAEEGQIALLEQYVLSLNDVDKIEIYQTALNAALKNEDLNNAAYLIKKSGVQITEALFQELLNNNKIESVRFLISLPAIQSLGLSKEFLLQEASYAKTYVGYADKMRFVLGSITREPPVFVSNAPLAIEKKPEPEPNPLSTSPIASLAPASPAPAGLRPEIELNSSMPASASPEVLMSLKSPTAKSISESLSEQITPALSNPMDSVPVPEPTKQIPSVRVNRKKYKTPNQANKANNNTKFIIALSILLLSLVVGGSSAIVLGGPMGMVAGVIALSSVLTSVLTASVIKYRNMKKASKASGLENTDQPTMLPSPIKPSVLAEPPKQNKSRLSSFSFGASNKKTRPIKKLKN